jgi:hypothetical protein
MRIPTPLLFVVELWYSLYLGENKLSNSVLLVFNLMADKKIIVDCNARIAATFLLCLAQPVEIFNELQFWALKVK